VKSIVVEVIITTVTIEAGSKPTLLLCKYFIFSAKIGVYIAAFHTRFATEYPEDGLLQSVNSPTERGIKARANSIGCNRSPSPLTVLCIQALILQIPVPALLTLDRLQVLKDRLCRLRQFSIDVGKHRAWCFTIDDNPL